MFFSGVEEIHDTKTGCWPEFILRHVEGSA